MSPIRNALPAVWRKRQEPTTSHPLTTTTAALGLLFVCNADPWGLHGIAPLMPPERCPHAPSFGNPRTTRKPRTDEGGPIGSSLARSNANRNSIYCINHSLVTSVSSGIPANLGHLLENLVFTVLPCAHTELFYDRTRNGREVDFILVRRSRPRLLIQVCESLASPKTRKREVAAINEAMGELCLETATVVTRSETERIDTDHRSIDVVPAWRFLLDTPESPE